MLSPFPLILAMISEINLNFFLAGWLFILNPYKRTLRVMMLANGFELSGRGTPDRYLFYPPLSYNLAFKSRRIPGPLQRIVRQRKGIGSGHV